MFLLFSESRRKNEKLFPDNHKIGCYLFFKYCIEKIICRGFGCPEWDYNTKEENLLKKHVTENHPFPSIFPKCPECDFYTKEENLLKNHVTENHPFPSIFEHFEMIKLPIFPNLLVWKRESNKDMLLGRLMWSLLYKKIPFNKTHRYSSSGKKVWQMSDQFGSFPCDICGLGFTTKIYLAWQFAI